MEKQTALVSVTLAGRSLALVALSPLADDPRELQAHCEMCDPALKHDILCVMEGAISALRYSVFSPVPDPVPSGEDFYDWYNRVTGGGIGQ